LRGALTAGQGRDAERTRGAFSCLCKPFGRMLFRGTCNHLLLLGRNTCKMAPYIFLRLVVSITRAFFSVVYFVQRYAKNKTHWQKALGRWTKEYTIRSSIGSPDIRVSHASASTHQLTHLSIFDGAHWEQHRFASGPHPDPDLRPQRHPSTLTFMVNHTYMSPLLLLRISRLLTHRACHKRIWLYHSADVRH